MTLRGGLFDLDVISMVILTMRQTCKNLENVKKGCVCVFESLSETQGISGNFLKIWVDSGKTQGNFFDSLLFWQTWIVNNLFSYCTFFYKKLSKGLNSDSILTFLKKLSTNLAFLIAVHGGTSVHPISSPIIKFLFWHVCAVTQGN